MRMRDVRVPLARLLEDPKSFRDPALDAFSQEVSGFRFRFVEKPGTSLTFETEGLAGWAYAFDLQGGATAVLGDSTIVSAKPAEKKIAVTCGRCSWVDITWTVKEIRIPGPKAGKRSRVLIQTESGIWEAPDECRLKIGGQLSGNIVIRQLDRHRPEIYFGTDHGSYYQSSFVKHLWDQMD